MFEHFTFGVPTRCDDSTPHDVSPCDTSFLPPATPPYSSNTARQERDGSLADLASQMSEQTITHPELVSSYFYCLPSPPADYDDDMFLSVDNEDFDTKSAPSTPMELSRPNPKQSFHCRRLQRQLNTQIQCSTGHMKNLSALVSDMVSTSSQCSVQTPSTCTSSSSTTENATQTFFMSISESGIPQPTEQADEESVMVDDFDEGFYEGPLDDTMEASMIMNLRRASAPGGIRKYSSSVQGLARLRSELMPGSNSVKSAPRMRKKIGRRKRRVGE